MATIKGHYERENREIKAHFESREEVVTVNGITGILVNKAEIDNWRGPIPLSEYPINDDPNPEIIRRTLDASSYNSTQEITIRYLEPPTPPPPGEIIIQQEKSIIPPPAPPIIIRQSAQAIKQKEALIIREAPPKMVAPIGRKIVKILGPKVPPPPRKLIIERPPPMAEKAQSIIIERWLAPKLQPRRVIFEGVAQTTLTKHAPIRNEIIEYEAPKVTINKEFKDLGVTRMDPNEYWSKYGNTLIESHNLPDFVKDIRPPPGLVLASDFKSQKLQLEGDIQYLSQIDLEREGLSEYLSYVQTSISTTSGSSGVRFYDNGGRSGGVTDTYYERSSGSPPRGSDVVRTLVDGAFSSSSAQGATSVSASISSSSASASYKSTTINDF